jgi:2-alkenal reductase
MKLDQPVTQSTLLVVVVVTLLTGLFSGAAAGALVARGVTDDDDSPPAVVVTATPAATTPAAAGADSTATVGVTLPLGVTATPTQAVPIATPGANPVAGSIVELVERVNPAVVTVINKQDFAGFFNEGADLQPVGAGTGFIISADGYIVTNQHVVASSSAIDVIFDDGTRVPAQLVGSDPFTDLAVVRVDGPVPAVVPLGDSTVLKPGQTVIAIGSALGNYTNTVTEGVVSGLGRRLELFSGAAYENLIQHDAPINPGNSGGPLFNLAGEVVGVNSYRVSEASNGFPAEGLGFAIASETVQSIVTLLIADGKVERPYLGISYEVVTPLIAESLELPVDHGVIVTDLPSNGPARDAGILVGDIITRINGQELNREHPFVNVLFQHKPGETVEIELVRPDTSEVIVLQLTLGLRPDIP